MNELFKFLELIAKDGYDGEVNKEDGIPYISIWEKSFAPMTLARAKNLAQKLKDFSSGPTHFHRLEGDSVSFFVFTKNKGEKPFSQQILDDYGTPVEDWLSYVG